MPDIDLIEEMENDASVRLTNNYNYVEDEDGRFRAKVNLPEPEPMVMGEGDMALDMGDTDNVTMGGIAKATGRAVAGGVMDAANGFIDMTGEMGEVLNNIVPYGYITFTPEDGFGWQEQKPTDIPEWQLPTTPRGNSMVEGFGRGITQFIAGMALTRGAGTSIPQIVNRGAVSAMLFNPEDGGLVTMLREFNIGKEFLEVIDSQVPEDAPAYRKLYGRLQNGLEELGFGYLAEGVIQGFKHIARTPDLLQKTKDLIQRIDIDVDPNTLGTMGGNITIGKKPERVIDDLGFYSQLREEVGNVKQEKFGSIEQFTNMLEGKVKKEELDWSGLGDAFQGKKFTKQEVIDYLDNNHVELEEIRKKGSRIDDMDNPYAEDYEINIEPTNDQPMVQQMIGERFDSLYEDYTGGSSLDNYDQFVLTPIANRRFDELSAENGWQSIVRESKEREFRGDMDAARESGDVEAMEKVVFMLGKVNRDTIEEQIMKEATEIYDNDPYYSWSNDEGYRITGNENYLVLEDSAGSQFAEVSSLSEAQIQMQARLLDDGIIQFEDGQRYPEDIRPDDDMPALGDNNPPKDNIVEGGPTVHERFTEKGGTNYREFLIRNKNYEGDPSYVKLKLTPDELEELKTLDFAAGAYDLEAIKNNTYNSKALTEEENIRYKTLLEKQGLANSEAKLSEFRASAHWRGENEKNIIFHVRMTDRTGPNGEKVLYVDELQSDWAQQGSGRAGLGSFKTDTTSKELTAIKERLTELNASGEMPFLEDGVTINRKYDEELKERAELVKQRKSLKQQNVPRGPYVQDTDKWTALAIKRLLRVAVEEGYDSIAFSSGEVHKQRWNEPGLIEFYDSKIPSVTKNVINKNLKIKDYKYTTSTLKDVEDVFSAYDDTGQERFIITITPEIREKVMKGISLFSVGAIATEGMLEEREPANGY
tara:strand:+ start:3911 stop:6697 length:2787 start_codon:yes stop_codon:yes gene_type:complete